jgi:hypothetical protein
LKWINAAQLGEWGSTLQARDKVPALVADLIWATVSNVRRFRFLHGESGQVRGFDGYLDAEAASPFVPDGKSIWEFGTNGAGKAKAEKDYEKRTDEVDDETKADCTLVIVTPRTWDTPRDKVEDWLTEKNDGGPWRKVVYLDGPVLEEWLAQCPAVASRWARVELNLAPQTGVASTEEFWQSFSARFNPALVEDVLLAGRESQADDLLRRLSQEGGRLAYSADTTDEVIAFTVAAIRKAPENIRKPLEARTLVVDTEDAANFLMSTSNLIFLPRNLARTCAGQLLLRGPTVVSAGADDKKHGHIELRRPTSRELGTAFTKMGMSDEQGYDTARKCGRSLAVLARQYPSGTAEKPQWLDDAKPLVPIMLAGSWESDAPLDQAILSSLSQQDYDDAEDELRSYLNQPDSPIECIGNVWATRAPVDAFLHLAPLVGRKHLQLFRDAVIAVFGKVAESHKPPNADEPFVFQDKRDRGASHSEHLRNGLMTTLLHMAVLHRPAGFTVAVGSPQLFVDELIASLPNLATDHRFMACMGQDLALLAEASPNSFLDALERQLEGPNPSILPIFNEHPGILTPVTYHTNLLWALEVLAWDSEWFDRSVLCLAKLAAIDPGGKLSNRPVNSLREIFLSWMPSTAVKTKRRLAVLEATIKAVPSIAWPMLATLLPRSGDTASSTAKPKFRDYDHGDMEVVTYGLIWESEAKIVALALREAGSNFARWASLIEALPNMQIDTFHAVMRGIDDALSSAECHDRTKIWKALHGEVKRHQKYSTMDWALPQDLLESLLQVTEKHKPAELLDEYSWLFDDWMPPVEDADDEDADPMQGADDSRVNALKTIYESLGAQGLVDLMARVKIPRLVAHASCRLELSFRSLLELLTRLLDASVAEQELSAGSIIADGKTRYGQQWEDNARLILISRHLSPDSVARVLEALPESSQTWQYVRTFGETVENIYWSTKTPYRIDATTDELLYAIERYRAVRRPSAALSAASQRLDEIQTPDVVALLIDNVQESNLNPQSHASSGFFDIEKVIAHLAKRSDITLQQLAGLEFAYFPMLRHDARTLHKMLLEQPSFFVEMVSKVFRGKGEEPREISELESKHATNAYRLLKSLKTLPGQSEQDLDAAELMKWCQEVQRLAGEVNRREVADQIIGQVLAHAPADQDDGAWPHGAVRAVIETLASADMERGISIERINMRGVYSKQIGEGGDQERALAQQVREWAEASSGLVRTRALLEQIAQTWDAYAVSADTEAAKQALRF